MYSSHKEIKILDTQTKSEVLDIGHYSFISFLFPVMDDGDVTFEVSNLKGGIYLPLKKMDGSAVTFVCGTGEKASPYVDELAGHRYVKVVSATPQTADRTITVIFKWR